MDPTPRTCPSGTAARLGHHRPAGIRSPDARRTRRQICMTGHPRVRAPLIRGCRFARMLVQAAAIFRGADSGYQAADAAGELPVRADFAGLSLLRDPQPTRAAPPAEGGWSWSYWSLSCPLQ